MHNAETCFLSPRPPSNFSLTNLNGVLHPHRRSYTALLPPYAITTPAPARTWNLQHSQSTTLIAFHRAVGRQQRYYLIVRDQHAVTDSFWERRNVLFQDLPSRFIGPVFVPPSHHPVPQRPWTYQDLSPACAPHVFTERQLPIRVPTTPQDKDSSSRGVTASTRIPPCPHSRL